MSDNMEKYPTTQQLENEIKRVKHSREYRRIIRNTLSSLLVVAAAAVIISMLFLPVLRITGTSMEPTLKSDQLVMCRKRSNFERRDIIAFYYNNQILVKRVIAVSGDMVEIKTDGTVYVNSSKIDEPYVEEKSLGECNIDMPYEVPEQKVFVMGDNRATSVDSRSTTIGCISEEAVIGKVVFRVWPFKSIKKL